MHSYDEEDANDIIDVVELYMLSGECATLYELTLKIPSLLHIWSSDPLRAHNHCKCYIALLLSDQ